MNMYQVPPDTKEKEKVIGGLFDWGQFFWFLAGAGIGIIIFFVEMTITNVPLLAGIFGLMGVATTLPFVFVKKRGMTLFSYLYYRNKLKRENAFLPNRRKDVIK